MLAAVWVTYGLFTAFPNVYFLWVRHPYLGRGQTHLHAAVARDLPFSDS